jgi:hypothetical protein
MSLVYVNPSELQTHFDSLRKWVKENRIQISESLEVQKSLEIIQDKFTCKLGEFEIISCFKYVGVALQTRETSFTVHLQLLK